MLTKTHDTQEVCLNVSVLSQPERHSNKLLNRSFTSGASVLHQPKEWKVGKSRVNSFFKHESESIEFLIMQVWKGSHFWRTINILTVLFWGVSLLTAWNSRHRLPHALWRIKAPRKRYISRGYKLAWSAAVHGSHLIASVTLCLFFPLCSPVCVSMERSCVYTASFFCSTLDSWGAPQPVYLLLNMWHCYSCSKIWVC